MKTRNKVKLKINSISPNATYYKEAMQWAENYINGYGR